MQVVDDSITTAFTSLGITVLNTHFVDGVTDTLDLISRDFACFELVDERLHIGADTAVLSA